jgi:hypothetical protein
LRTALAARRRARPPRRSAGRRPRRFAEANGGGGGGDDDDDDDTTDDDEDFDPEALDGEGEEEEGDIIMLGNSSGMYISTIVPVVPSELPHAACNCSLWVLVATCCSAEIFQARAACPN